MLLEISVDSVRRLLWAATVACGVIALTKKILECRKIHKLGGRAKSISDYWFFFGLDWVLRMERMAKKNQFLEFWEGKFEKMGSHTLDASVMGRRMIVTDDPENIKAILADQFHDYGKGESFHKQWKSFLGDSIFATDGKAWKHSRQLIRSQFIRDRVSDLETLDRHVGRMLEIVPCDGSAVDMSDLFSRLTLDSATDYLLGCSVDSLGSPRVEFAHALAAVLRHMCVKLRLGPLGFLLPEGTYRRSVAVLDSFVGSFVEKTLRMRPEELKTKNEGGYNFLHALAEFTRDKRMLRDQIFAVMLASRDSTASVLSWTMYELARHPEVVEKLRAEILERVGPHRAPTYTDLRGMRYLQNILNETLRVYPAVPFNIRTALKDSSLPRGSGPRGMDPVGVPAGTQVLYSALSMQRRVDLFGPGVDAWDPERWYNWAPKSWQYIPFSGGPRICVGQQFALAEMGYALARIFQKFVGVESRATGKQFLRLESVLTPGVAVRVAFKPALDG